MRTIEAMQRPPAGVGASVKVLVLMGLVAAVVSLSGCLWLAIPGLAYSGYQYEKTGKLPGMPSTSPDPADSQHKASAQATPSNEIE